MPSEEGMYTRVKRLQRDGVIEKCGEIYENGGKKYIYEKKGVLIF